MSTDHRRILVDDHMNPEANVGKDIKPASPDKPKNATTDWGRDFVSINLMDVKNVISTVGITHPTGDRESALREAEAKARTKGGSVLVYQLAGVFERREVEVPTLPVVGQTYKTRDGSSIRIVHRVAIATKFPFCGIRIDAAGKLQSRELVELTEDGRFFMKHPDLPQRDHGLDLICTRLERKFGLWPAVRTE